MLKTTILVLGILALLLIACIVGWIDEVKSERHNNKYDS